jgi:hypothetical protein
MPVLNVERRATLLRIVGADKVRDREETINTIKAETNSNPPIFQRKTLEPGLPI